MLITAQTIAARISQARRVRRHSDALAAAAPFPDRSTNSRSRFASRHCIIKRLPEDGPRVRALKCQLSMNVFIKCPECGHPNCLDEIRPTRTELAILRGSEEPIRCKNCQADMDTMTAFCGERVGSEVVRRDDPKS